MESYFANHVKLFLKQSFQVDRLTEFNFTLINVVIIKQILYYKNGIGMEQNFILFILMLIKIQTVFECDKQV